MMRGGGGGRRRGGKSVKSERQIFETNHNSTKNNRDSDASYCSNRRPSSTGRLSTVSLNDRSHQSSSALRTINSYLSSHSAPFLLKPPLPSAKDITETIRFIFTRLYWFIDTTTTNSCFKLDEELPLLLKYLNCPIKLNKSALKAPGTPHTWPSLLPVIHWLVQICQYNDLYISTSTANTSTNRSFLKDNKLLAYALESYSLYIRGDDDDAVEALDREFTGKLEKESESAANEVKILKEEVSSLEAQLESWRSAPSAREALEKDKSLLEEDVRKFHAIIDEVQNSIATLKKGLEDKHKELDTKLEENKRISEENEELKKRTEAQTINLRDVERMKRELQAVERDIAEAEVARNAWDDKSWDLDTNIENKFKKLESLSMECNQAIRRLMLGNGFQYVLNAKGTTPAEVLGIDYKSILKLALSEYAENIKKTSVAKLEELISLQQQSQENATKLEAKRNRLTELQSKIHEIESQLQLIKKETHDYTSQCAEESRRMLESLKRGKLNLDTMEREAEKYLKMSDLKLQETIKQRDEEIEMFAHELLALVDLVSRYKETTESTILDMKRGLSETAKTVAKAYKESLIGRKKQRSENLGGL